MNEHAVIKAFRQVNRSRCRWVAGMAKGRMGGYKKFQVMIWGSEIFGSLICYLPLMSNGFARAIIFIPTCSGRVCGAEPVFEFRGGHVDEVVEFSGILYKGKVYRCLLETCSCGEESPRGMGVWRIELTQ